MDLYAILVLFNNKKIEYKVNNFRFQENFPLNSLFDSVKLYNSEAVFLHLILLLGFLSNLDKNLEPLNL